MRLGVVSCDDQVDKDVVRETDSVGERKKGRVNVEFETNAQIRARVRRVRHFESGVETFCGGKSESINMSHVLV